MLTLADLRKRLQKGITKISLTPKEFKEYIDIIHPDDSLLGPYLAGNKNQYMADRKELLDKGVAYYRGVEVVRKKK